MIIVYNNKLKGMPVTITEPSKEIVSRLIRNEFDSIDFEMDYIYEKASQLIETAIELGLLELAEEMQNEKYECKTCTR